ARDARTHRGTASAPTPQHRLSPLHKQKAPRVSPRGFCFLALAVLSAASHPAWATRGALFQSLGGSLLARGLLRYSTKLKNILGDFGNRPGFRSSLHEHIGFHDLATDWPQ